MNNISIRLHGRRELCISSIQDEHLQLVHHREQFGCRHGKHTVGNLRRLRGEIPLYAVPIGCQAENTNTRHQVASQDRQVAFID